MPRKRTLRNSALFAEFVSWLLERGNSVRFRANGESMNPAIRDGEAVHVFPMNAAPIDVVPMDAAPTSTSPVSAEPTGARGDSIRPGEVVLAVGPAGFKAHRVLCFRSDRNLYIMRGDSVQTEDTPVSFEQILGRVLTMERQGWGVRLARRIVGKIRKISTKLLASKWLRSTPGAWLRAL